MLVITKYQQSALKRFRQFALSPVSAKSLRDFVMHENNYKSRGANVLHLPALVVDYMVVRLMDIKSVVA